MISWYDNADGWGTREQAIPGEWALLLLIIVLGAVLGLLVLWFTLLRHERTVRRRTRLRGGLLLTEIGPAADEAVPEPVEQAEESAGDEPSDDAESEPESESGSESESKPESEPESESEKPVGSASGQRKLTDEILSRVEAELAERDAPRWKDLASLVHREFGVTVHPSSIQKAVKRRRLAEAAQSA